MSNVNVQEFLDQALQFPNGFASKVLFVLFIGYFTIFLTIGITQCLKNKRCVIGMRTEKLAIIVSTFLYGFLYCFYLFVFDFGFLWYELATFIVTGVIIGNISSLVAEKLFKQKKK